LLVKYKGGDPAARSRCRANKRYPINQFHSETCEHIWMQQGRIFWLLSINSPDDFTATCARKPAHDWTFMLRLSPPRETQIRHSQQESASFGLHSDGLTGGVCKKQGHIRRTTPHQSSFLFSDLMTFVY